MKRPVVGIHGLQGSGKTYLLKKIMEELNFGFIRTSYINIKGTFSPIVETVHQEFLKMGYNLDEAQMKKLILAISTYGEMNVDTRIWTKKWISDISYYPDNVVLLDDVRTTFNLDGLLSLDRPVVLFKLDVSEEIRRERLGNNWRDNGGYTEQLLEKPENLPENFTWIDLKEDWSLKEVIKAVEAYL